ncbi:MAG: hypothetical protein IPP25_13615 [Saprospiraceae bacterium]|nr:hypothetical protein [Candidatus Opimibacter skivensis]
MKNIINGIGSTSAVKIVLSPAQIALSPVIITCAKGRLTPLITLVVLANHHVLIVAFSP